MTRDLVFRIVRAVRSLSDPVVRVNVYVCSKCKGEDSCHSFAPCEGGEWIFDRVKIH